MKSNYEFDRHASDKLKVFNQAARILLSKGFRLMDLDAERPWGFYLSVDESQAERFIDEFYPDVDLEGIDTILPLRPKFLGFAPEQRLSWQWHHRRSEVWRPVIGDFQLVMSKNDTEAKPKIIKEGQVITIPQGTRHRGIGLDHWALVAEIWQHTDPTNPSSEEDIVRVQDDFGRK